MEKVILIECPNCFRIINNQYLKNMVVKKSQVIICNTCNESIRIFKSKKNVFIIDLC